MLDAIHVLFDYGLQLDKKITTFP